MTKVSYIHGAKDYPKARAKKRFINYGNMTDGELRLSLIAEQLNIVAEYYGSSEHKDAQDAIINNLQSGISGTVRVPMGDIGKAVALEINKARRMTRPAAGISLQLRKGIGIGNPIIPLDDCDELRQFIVNQYGQYDDDGEYIETQASRDCRERNNNLILFNEHLEKSAHHLLYEYTEGLSNATVSTKRVLHRNAVSKLAEITDVSRTNLRLWMRNGVLRSNVEQGAPPLQPYQVIEILRQGRDGVVHENDEIAQNASVGAPPLFIIIIAAITAAISASAQLLNSLSANKRQQMLVAAQGIGTPTFGPEELDWNSGGADNEANNLFSGNITPLILGGAALFLLK